MDEDIFYPTCSSSLSKPEAYITHNATKPLTIWLDTVACYVIISFLLSTKCCSYLPGESWEDSRPAETCCLYSLNNKDITGNHQWIFENEPGCLSLMPLFMLSLQLLAVVSYLS